MPMEVKKKDEWKNIIKLIILRWKNGKFVFWFLVFFGFCLAVGLFSLKSLWMSGGYAVDDWVMLENYGGFGNFAIVFFMAGILFCTGSVLNEDSVGMYPGTVKTRYISRILSDWLFLLVFVAGVSLLNLLQTAGYMWMAKRTGNFAGVLISGNFGWGILLTLLCILALYSVILFLQTLYERVGAGKFWIGAGIVIVYVMLELKTSLCILQIILGSIHHFICQKGQIPARIALVCGVVLLVFMVLSFCLVRGIHSWKKENNYGGKFVLRFFVLFVSYLVLGICFKDYGYSRENMSMRGTLEQQIENGNYLVEDTVQSFVLDQNVSKKLNQSMNDLETDLSIGWVSLEQAKKVGIVPENFSLGSQKICIRTVVNNLEVQGTSLTKGFLNATLNVTDGTYQIKQPLKVILNNNYLSLFTNLFLSEEERGYLEELKNENLGNFLGYFIVYNQEDIPEDEVPMSMDAGSALDEFMWQIEE